MNESREQKLVNICFSCVLTVLDSDHHEAFMQMSKEQQAEWVSSQLEGCGFPTEPTGLSHGVLK